MAEAGWISASIDTWNLVFGTIWRYSKDQYQYKANLEVFNDRKEELRQLRETIQSNLIGQLHTGRKIPQHEVPTWLNDAQDILQLSVEDEVSQSGCMSSHICRTRVLKRRTADLVQILNRGRSLSHLPSLVSDDYSAILRDDMQCYQDQKDKLLSILGDVQLRLHAQLQDGGKIEKKAVKLWLRNVEEKTSPAATSFENQFANGPHDGDFPRRLKDRKQQLEVLLHEGTLLPESLVVDDYTQTLGDDDMKTFGEWKEKLKGKYQDVGGILQSQLRLGKIEMEQVKIWKKQVEETTASAADVQNQLVGRVKKIIQKMEKLHDEGCKLPESLVIDDPSASAPALLTPELQGSDAVKAEILGHLVGDETSKIGVWGMGGVGKTTIMEHVYNQLLNEPKLNKVVWVTVSQTFNVLQIQQEIARNLKEEESLSNQQGDHLRPAVLSKILEKHKPYVLILDDVWESFELHKVGIPEIPGCKLVLTTRSEQVARMMGCKGVKVNTLSHDAALKLFKDKAGVEAMLDDGGAEKSLDEMVRECDGLPLAIITVVASMKGISDPCIWRAALNQLKEGKRNVAGTENDQFRTLKFSYDRLSDEKIKHCFLYCAMFPEDKKILKDELIECWIDEELIDVVGTRQGMKDQGHANLNKLVENCLLESVEVEDYYGNEQSFVKMHDVMRDMALWITRTSIPRFLVKAGVDLEELPEEHEWEEDLLKVSLMSNNIKEIPSSLPLPRCPILTTLLLSNNDFSTIPEHFFDHMPELKVLDLSYNEELRSLPSSVSKLVKLTTLLLRYCKSLKEVPSLSNLTALKKLDLYEAGLEEVPHGLEVLLNLKYLDIGRSSDEEVSAGWKKLVSEILPNLSKLQHLGLDPTVPVEGGQLSGIWPKLENFYGGFRTWSDMCIFLSKRQKNLYHYNICVGNPNNDLYHIFLLKYINIYDINICGEPGSIPSDVQLLAISGCNDVRSLNAISGFQDVFDLQRCMISYCREVEYAFSGLNQLSKLKRLELWDLENLKGLFDSEAAPPPLAVFSSLEEISIRRCPKIKKLFPTTLQYLPNLKAISIKNCSQLEEIVVASSSEEEGRVIHAKLEKLTLKNLPMLRSISSLTVTSVFDSLKELSISGCRNLEYVFRGQFIFNSLKTLEKLKLEGLHNLKSVFHEEADESITPLSGTEAVSFRLKELCVEDCPQLKNIFPNAVQVGSFKNLELIEVKRCDGLVEIMEAVSSGTEEDQSEPILPNLKTLSITKLPVLRRICSALLVPGSLGKLTVEDCPNLSWECLFSSRMKLPQTLTHIRLKGVKNLQVVFDDEATLNLATTSFSLKEIWVEDCPQLKRIFTHAERLDHSQNIRSIDVIGCDELEDIVSSNSEEEPLKVTSLPKLERLQLRNLPKLKRVCISTSALICDSLKDLEISGCTELKRVPLHLPQSDNGQLSPPPNLREIELSENEIEWWESLEWDQPNAKNILARFCKFTSRRGSGRAGTVGGRRTRKKYKSVRGYSSSAVRGQ